MNLEELNFSFSAVQWLVTVAIGIYAWVISRQAATNGEVLELRTRVIALEERVRQLPTQQQLAQLMVQLGATEAQLNNIGVQLTAMSRRVERIDDFLMKQRGGK
ncbi:uncharacterized protein DUF2730 [Serratia fonticola]|uniref:Uncharacterized protein DUF2730 n=1 Tax=Serratia fonticola TaxID=47917 RepID=A0A542BJG1_SERFO|nr:DUF2730 family protein [Serratia fonticola]TQI78714.1 uncharacterized protein DUF2730 [Serratia fonticola]TQI99264.1 uncharacterized protein DUF2730 [Serratia fonticola]TVZ68789.1 uncharacterized protein DUF2730 [Serratia fonticola]